MKRQCAPQSNVLDCRALFTNAVAAPAMRRMIGLGMVSAAVFVPVHGMAQPHRDSNWPCQQIKVSELSLAAVWSGPPVDPRDGHWKDNAGIAGMVEKLAPRRQPIEQTQSLLHDFAQHAGPDKQAQLLQILAGVFAVLDAERDSVISGLDRFGVRQKQLAADIRADNEKLRSLQSDSTSDPKAVQQMTQKVTWEAEVFQDRRQALGSTCDVPGKIEQRLFALAHQIEQELN